jgi:hypothetical protein
MANLEMKSSNPTPPPPDRGQAQVPSLRRSSASVIKHRSTDRGEDGALRKKPHAAIFISWGGLCFRWAKGLTS